MEGAQTCPSGRHGVCVVARRSAGVAECPQEASAVTPRARTLGAGALPDPRFVLHVGPGAERGKAVAGRRARPRTSLCQDPSARFCPFLSTPSSFPLRLLLFCLLKLRSRERIHGHLPPRALCQVGDSVRPSVRPWIPVSFVLLASMEPGLKRTPACHRPVTRAPAPCSLLPRAPLCL